MHVMFVFQNSIIFFTVGGEKVSARCESLAFFDRSDITKFDGNNR